MLPSGGLMMLLTFSCYIGPGNIYVFNLYGAVCNMLSFLVSFKSCVLCGLMQVCVFFLFSVVRQYICCAFSTQVCSDLRANLDMSLQWKRMLSVLAVRAHNGATCVCLCVHACVHARREVSIRACSAVKPSPSACREGETWWQRKTRSFCGASQQTQPTDISEDGLSLAMHVIRRHGDSQHGRGVIDVAPNSPVQILFLKVSTRVGISDENSRFAARKSLASHAGRGVWKLDVASRL